jgi:hypothetical protein
MLLAMRLASSIVSTLAMWQIARGFYYFFMARYSASPSIGNFSR